MPHHDKNIADLTRGWCKPHCFQKTDRVDCFVKDIPLVDIPNSEAMRHAKVINGSFSQLCTATFAGTWPHNKIPLFW